MENSSKPEDLSDGSVIFEPGHLNKIQALDLSHDLSHTYRKDEVIVYLDESDPARPMLDKIAEIKKTFGKMGIAETDIRVDKCDNCDIPVLRFSAPGIDTIISSSGVTGGSGGKTGTVGESYSLNFLSQIPAARWDLKDHDLIKTSSKDDQKKEVRIAVLDTGIDRNLVNPAYLCADHSNKNGMPCFSDIHGCARNFVKNNNDPFDDNKGKHGSLVSQYIINQFTEKSENRVCIMPLKTHDEHGLGDLFSIICAIHFAMAKSANIINASWGFYYYFDALYLKYFHNLIGNELRKSGILFVTASGNKIQSDDNFAEKMFHAQTGGTLNSEELRDLKIHRFFPAELSAKAENLVTVTTTNVKVTGVSDQQNHSNIYVDLGVKADSGPDKDPRFDVPFKLNPPADPIAGSSFATAIATGVIGANSDPALFKPNLTKGDFIDGSGIIGGAPLSGIIGDNSTLATKLIRKGRYVKEHA
jgi:hypothetical protein